MDVGTHVNRFSICTCPEKQHTALHPFFPESVWIGYFCWRVTHTALQPCNVHIGSPDLGCWLDKAVFGPHALGMAYSYCFAGAPFVFCTGSPASFCGLHPLTVESFAVSIVLLVPRDAFACI